MSIFAAHSFAVAVVFKHAVFGGALGEIVRRPKSKLPPKLRSIQEAAASCENF